MKVSTEQREPREAVLKVELDTDDVEPYLDQAYRQSVRRLSIPGFRKGKAPRRIVEQLYGRGYLLNEAMDTVIQEFTSKAVEDENLEIGGVPSVSLDQFDPPSFTATVPLQPLVDLGDFESVRIAIDKVSIAKAQVDGVLEQLRSELAVLEPVDDQVQMEDLINLTIIGWVDEDEGRREIVRSEETDYIPRPNTTFPIPNLDEHLVGLPVGEETQFTVKVSADFDQPELAGRTANFEATIHSIKRKNLAPLDDEFAKGVGDGYDSLKQLRDRIREDLVEREERAAKAKHQNETLTQVVEGAVIQISALIINHELEHYVHEREDNVKAGRISNFADYQEWLSWQGMSEEEIHEQARPQVEERLKRAHVLRAVMKREAFEATEEEVDNEIATIVGGYGDSGAEIQQLFEDPERRDQIAGVLVQRKTLDYLSEIALRNDVKAATKKTSAKPKASTTQKKAPASGGRKKSGGS